MLDRFKDKIDVREPNDCWHWNGPGDIYGKCSHEGRSCFDFAELYEGSRRKVGSGGLAKAPEPTSGLQGERSCDSRSYFIRINEWSTSRHHTSKG